MNEERTGEKYNLADKTISFCSYIVLFLTCMCVRFKYGGVCAWINVWIKASHIYLWVAIIQIMASH